MYQVSLWLSVLAHISDQIQVIILTTEHLLPLCIVTHMCTFHKACHLHVLNAKTPVLKKRVKNTCHLLTSDFSLWKYLEI